MQQAENENTRLCLMPRIHQGAVDARVADIFSNGDACFIRPVQRACVVCILVGCCHMRAILDYCTGGLKSSVPAGTLIIHEGQTTGHLYVLIEGRLEVVKGDTVVASINEPGAVLGEMSVLLDQPHTATVRAASDSTIYEFSDAASFLREQPAVALLIARLLAQRLNVATSYLADIKRQYAGHGNHLAMVGDLLESMVNLTQSKVSPGSDRQPDPRM
ncbi:MAG: 3,5-cyclic-nucleotide phosphodiesterase [Tardiphaga sp.]|jgi:CRP/FNR family cyclic AMP-dependent transcriptional regulator|nr:3,5-cyclic-nucleotide phosphodiesterase [Tardiphaga sp.]